MTALVLLELFVNKRMNSLISLWNTVSLRSFDSNLVLSWQSHLRRANLKPEDSLCCERSVQQQTTDIYFSELTPLIVFVTFYRKYRPSASKWRWLRLFSYSNHKTRTFEFQSTIVSNRLFFTFWITLKQLLSLVLYNSNTTYKWICKI